MRNKPNGYRQVIVNEIKEVVTNADSVNQSETYALQKRGLRDGKAGMLMQRDFGTRQIYPTNQFPQSPIPTAQGKEVTLRAPIKKLFDPVTGNTHNIVLGRDNNGKARFYVDANNGDNATPSWQDLTRVVQGTVNAGATTYFDLTSSTITENLTDVTTITNDECNGWIAYNKTAKEYSKAVTNAVDNGSGLVRLTITAHGLVTGTRIYVTGVAGTTEANGGWNVTVINANTVDLQGSAFANPYTSGGTVYRITPQVLYVADTANNGATVRFTFIGVLLSSVVWLAGDVVLLVRSRALLNRDSFGMGTYGWGYGLGNDYRVETTEVEAQRKLNLYLSKRDGNGVYQGEIPLRIQKVEEQGRFYTGASTYLKTIPAGWYLEDPMPFSSFGRVGTIEAPVAGASGTLYVNIDGSSTEIAQGQIYSHKCAIAISYTVTNMASLIYRDSGKIHYMRIYVVPIYNSYMRGDPIAEFFVKTNNTLYSPQVTFLISLSQAMTPNNLTAFEFYAQLITDVEYDGTTSGGNTSGKEFSDADMRLAKIIYLDRVNDSTAGTVTVTPPSSDPSGAVLYSWTLNSLLGNWKFSDIVLPSPFNRLKTRIQFAEIKLSPTTASILSALGHAVVKERKTPTPRFGVRAARDQGALSVIDIDDATLAISGFSADAPMDDIFPQVELDNNGNRQRIFLQSRGRLIGVKFVVLQYPAQNPTPYVVAFKPREIEVISLSGGGQWIIPADVASQDSIVQHPNGIAWAGESGFYNFRYTGEIEIINRLTLNEYDGSAVADDGSTQITTTAYRSAIVAGFCEFTRELLFMVQQNLQAGGGTEYLLKRYNVDTQKWSSDRKFSNTASGLPVLYISSRPDKLVDMVVSNTLVLKYPVVGTYEDEVTFAGSSQNKGFPSLVMFNIGSVYSYDPTTTVFDFSLDHVGQVVSGSPTFTVSFFANDESAPFSTHDILVSSAQRTLRVRYRGAIHRLRVKIELAAASAHLVKELEISTMTIGVVVDKRGGMQ